VGVATTAEVSCDETRWFRRSLCLERLCRGSRVPRRTGCAARVARSERVAPGGTPGSMRTLNSCRPNRDAGR
jgi:hypothetical protein